MARIAPQFYKDFSSGMITNIAQNLRPKNSAEVLLNLDADENFGALTTRLGTGIVGSQLVDNMTILGLHQHIDHANSSNNLLFAALNASGGATSTIRNVATGSNVVTGLTANKKMRFLTYLGETLAINGTDAERAWNGSSWITTGGAFDLADFPGSNTCSLAIEFLDRVYAAGDTSNPDRLHYSGLSNGSAIAWDGDYVDIEAEDGGGPITALAKVPNYLLIFKERALKRFSYFSAFPESMVQIGAPNQESVVSGHGYVAFFSASGEDGKGFYITNGNRPISISHDRVKNIKKFVDAISSSYYSSVAGWVTDRGFAWSVGDLTVDGFTYTNAVLRWNRAYDQWTIRTYPTQFYRFASYLTSGQNVIVGGDDDGQIIQLDKPATYTDYSSNPINWMLKTSVDKFDYNQLKTISDRIILDCEHMETATVEITNERGQSKIFSTRGSTVLATIKQFFGANSFKGNKFQVTVRGTVEGARGILHEIEIPHIEAALNYD